MRGSILATATLAVALGVGLLAVSSASAAYEQVGTFAGTPGELQQGIGFGTELENSLRWPEKVQLGGTSGMAVNYTGAGGVAAGTIYSIGSSTVSSEDIKIERFNPDGSFSEAWTFNGSPPKERCGPAGDPANPSCRARPEGPTLVGLDVDVDQATGNVYALVAGGLAGENQIHAYSPDGSKLLAQFGPHAPGGQPTATAPGEIHESSPGGLAVNASGAVYVFDVNPFDSFYHRLMVFKPKTPGDYEEYEYAGQGQDISAGTNQQAPSPSKPATDAAGNLYIAGEDYVAKLDPTQPSPPLCEFKFPKGGIEGIAVNPQSGEVFFYTYKDKRIHQLGPCDGEGKFAEVGSFALAPQRTAILGMAVNPLRQFEPGRAAGVLYAASPSGEGGQVQGSSSNAKVESAIGYLFAPPRELAPGIVSEGVADVTSTAARLQGEVNPNGSQAHYSFQYITAAAYEENEPSERFAGASEVPLGGGLLEGSDPLPVGDSITALLPDSEYHYRLLATSHCSVEHPEKLCTGTGAAKAFRTYPLQTPGLPDARAFELVSPTEKHGGQVIPAEPVISSCTPHECKPGAAYNHSFPRQVSPDGDAIVYEGTPFGFEEGAKVENQYIARRSPSGWQSTNLTPRALFSKTGGYGYRAFSLDLSEGLLGQISPSLSPDAPPGYSDLYRQPSGDPSLFEPLLSNENALLQCAPGEESGSLKLTYDGASTDLSRIFFEANDALTEQAPGGCGQKNLYEWSAGQLHLINYAPGDGAAIADASFGSGTLLAPPGNNPPTVITHAISDDGSHVFWSSKAGQAFVRIDGTETREVKDPGRFLSASADGSKALLSDGCLYDLATEACEDLTQGKGGFKGIAGQSEDLSHLYFLDAKVLTGEEENDQGAKAQEGANNLYAWSEGTTSFIATLLADDSDDWQAALELRSAEASPDGRWLAFRSKAPLSGFDNTGPCEYDAQKDRFLAAPCPEVFLYDSQTAVLRCASCSPSGAPPLGPSVLRRMESPAGGQGQSSQPRYLLDSGRLYFDSQDALSQFDTNGRVEDVYQYEPEEVGSCKEAEGCLALISAGRGGADSNFLAIDPTGKNVFFTSRDQLNKPDEDQAIDLYDAREGGTPLRRVETLECQGEACQPPTSAPNDPTPASSSFNGSGQADETKPGKKHGRKHAKKKHKPRSKAKAKHNRGGAK